MMSSAPRSTKSPGWPRRICLVTEANTYLARGGAAAYLHQTVRLLRDLGAETHLFIANAMPATWRKAPAPGLAGYFADYASVRLADAWLFRDSLWNRRLGPWLGLAGLRSRPPGPERSGWLPPMTEDDAAQARRWIGGLQPDLVLANYFNAGPALADLPHRTGRAILVHDVMALLQPLLAATSTPAYIRPDSVAAETAAFRTADLCLAIQETEAAHIRAVAPDTLVETVPFACPVTHGDLASPRPPVAVFVGTAVQANIDALDMLLKAVWPRVHNAMPQARLSVVGTVGRAWTDPWPAGAEAAGFVPDIGTAYAGAALSLAPIRFGSGLKIKLVESLAHGVPVVATPVGAAGVTGAPAGALRIAETPEALADAILAVLSDPDAQAARAAARDFAAGTYGPDAVRARLAGALAMLADRVATRGDVA